MRALLKKAVAWLRQHVPKRAATEVGRKRRKRITTVMAVGLLVAAVLLVASQQAEGWRSDLWMGLGCEVLGGVALYWVLEWWFGQKDEADRETAALIADLTSTDKAKVRDAVGRLGRARHLYDGSLRGADLRGANLSKLPLARANLQGASLAQARLDGTMLVGAILEKADLSYASLAKADLNSADLRHAVLVGADLQGAELRSVDLRGANLSGAHLRGAITVLSGRMAPILDETTVLPDGKNWRDDSSLGSFGVMLVGPPEGSD